MLQHVQDHVSEPSDAKRSCVGEALHRCSFIRNPIKDTFTGLKLMRVW